MPKTKPNVFDGQNITASEFFKTHWQRSPYLFTNTHVDTNCLPNAKTLFELAAQEQVQSRIIYSEDQRIYQAIYDEPSAWQQVLEFKPTLLVSDIEKWYPSARQIMAWFPFIKNWRFDDLMMSYAPTGASVGAHTDHYDVFLLQVQGSRQWSYDTEPLADIEMVENSELAVIDHYQAQVSQQLNAGDILYIPPNIPHHGVSTSDDCITCSIGLRAPSEAELITAVIENLVEKTNTNQRFKDDVQSIKCDSAIGQHEINYLRQKLHAINQLSDDDLAEQFGKFVTAYRLFDDIDEGEPKGLKNVNQWCKSPFSVFAYHMIDRKNAMLFVNGESYVVDCEFAQRLCNQEQIESPETDLDVLNELIEAKAIRPF